MRVVRWTRVRDGQLQWIVKIVDGQAKRSVLLRAAMRGQVHYIYQTVRTRKVTYCDERREEAGVDEFDLRYISDGHGFDVRQRSARFSELC